jgi:hypothetical protein
MLGLNLSSAFRSVLTIYILIPFIIIPQLLFSGVMVKFDSLHIRQHEYVPVIGDLMIARWAFEAVATNQFKNNDFEKLYFNYDIDLAENTWNKTLADALNASLFNCLKYSDPVLVTATLEKVRRHAEELSGLSGIIIPELLLDSLKAGTYDFSERKRMGVLLDSIKSEFNNRWEKTTARRDLVTSDIQKKYGTAWLTRNLESSDNRKLRDIVLDNMRINRFVETDEKVIRKYQPGFMKPTSLTGRAHFYAPVKRIGEKEIDTYWFNTGVIWLITALLYMALYFRLPQKIISISDNLRMKKPE